MTFFWPIMLMFVVSTPINLYARLYKRQPSVIIQNKPLSADEPYNLKEWVNVHLNGDELIKATVGSRVEIECEAIGSPPPRTEWFYEDRLLYQIGFEEENTILNTAIGKVKSRLVIGCVSRRHQGLYRCSAISGTKTVAAPSATIVVDDGNGTEWTSSCDENAAEKPRIIMWGPTLLEVSDSDVTLPCMAVGNPKPTIYWIDNRNRCIYGDTVSSRYKVLQNGDLLISKISWQEDMGIFTCVAQNDFGEDKAESFLYPVKKE